jgi:hypothetical protein
MLGRTTSGAKRKSSQTNRFLVRRAEVEPLEGRRLLSTSVLFDLATPQSAPFPTDRFTVADETQLTARRVNLPLPDAVARPSDFADTRVLNTLDGFNLQPRLSIPFSGPIDPATVNSRTVFLVKLHDTVAPEAGGGRIVGVNQVVWEAASNTLHVESDELLEQHTRYALIVTGGVCDVEGQPVGPARAFERFRHDLNFGKARDAALKDYRTDLLGALDAASAAGVDERDVAAASVFTTMSATATLEKMRDQIHAATPATANFSLAADGSRTVFPLDQLGGVTFNRETRVGQPLSPAPVSLSLIRAIPDAVGTVAFGSFLSPDYEVAGEYIPPVGTRTGTPVVQRMNEVYFNLFLPAGPAPAGGWPVALHTHGAPEDKQGPSLGYVAAMAQQGVATILTNFVGRGFGARGTLTVTPATGNPVTLPAGGRGIDQNGDGVITPTEGATPARPNNIIGERDAHQQTVADWMQLVRVIQGGMDVDGDGAPDLDPAHISYFGLSLGAILGPMLVAVEPAVTAGVFISPGSGGGIQRGGTSVAFRPITGLTLQARVPSLINSPGLTSIGGVPVAGPFFNENMPLRNQPPVVNTVAGATAIQEFFDHAEWAGQSADPAAFAVHLQKEPLAGVPPKQVLILFSKGDQVIANPWTTAVIRAGDLADRSILYRNDLAFAENSAVPKNPHGFLPLILSPVPLMRQIALGAQGMVATYLASDGISLTQPQPLRFFEIPVAEPLPEDLSFIV